MPQALIRVPAQVKRGEAFEIKTLVSHPMEPGVRRDNTGQLIPRDIINRFVCTYNGEEVFRADLFPAIAANPFLAQRAAPIAGWARRSRSCRHHRSSPSPPAP